MGGWKHCLELLAIVLVAGAALVALGIAIAAVVTAHRSTKVLRTMPASIKPAEPVTPERRAQIDSHWATWRKRMADYGADVDLLVHPLRKEGIEITKEAGNWGRLGVQYAMLGNGGALAALPYVLIQEAGLRLPFLLVGDAIWSALWFAVGLLSAAACCLVAYLDCMVTAAMYWTNLRAGFAAADQRHFVLDDVTLPHEQTTNMIRVLSIVTGRTSLAGVALAMIAWIAFAWGAVRIIVAANV